MYGLARLLLALALLTSFVFVPTTTTHASADWAWDDPVVVIGGRSVAIGVGVWGTPSDVRNSVSVADITVYVPKGTVAYLSVAVNFYFRENVRFVQAGESALIGRPIPVTVVVTFEATQKMPAAMRITNVLTLQPADLLDTSITSGTTYGRLEASFNLH